MSTESSAAPVEQPLGRWADWSLLGGILALALGTIVAILGVSAAGLMLPGVYLLVLALSLLAASGVLRALLP